MLGAELGIFVLFSFQCLSASGNNIEIYLLEVLGALDSLSKVLRGALALEFLNLGPHGIRDIVSSRHGVKHLRQTELL